MTDLDDLLDWPRQSSYPWWQRAWWKLCRGWNAVVILPGRLKWFLQRGWRGWSDRDLWSLDHYLAGWLPSALRALKERKHGIPSGMFEGLETDATGNATSAAWAIATPRWEAIMDQMIAGFEAWNRAQDGLYEDEIGPYEMMFDRPAGMSQEDWAAHRGAQFEQRQALVARDMKTFEAGMALFAQHFGSLWD